MEDLRDIKGLEAISFWPLAYGWWILIITLILIKLTIYFLYKKKSSYKNSWKFKAELELKNLKQNIDQNTIISDSFELLKKISIIKFGRSSCANLTGIDWLTWLNKTDKSNFDWVKQCNILIDLQYAPHKKNTKEIKNSINNMHNAILNLVKN